MAGHACPISFQASATERIHHDLPTKQANQFYRRQDTLLRNNQFLISTHSPVFVTPDTINSITRIHRQGRQGSVKVALRDVNLPEKKNLVRMINSQNNERIFFADKVVLVEGVTDRIVFTSLLEGACAKFSNHQAIEIVEVGGKYNFSDYRALLKALSTDSYIIADRDYLCTVGNPTIKALFEVSDQKATETLIKDRKSTDRRALIAELRRAADTSDTEALKELLDYILKRHIQFKAHLSSDEERQLDTDLNRLRQDRCLILKYGEIENYLPPGVSDLREVVAMTIDPNWVNRVADEAKRVELATFLTAILELDPPDSTRLEQQMQRGEVYFPSAPI